MKKIAALSIGIILTASPAIAKFNPPEGYVPRDERSAMVEFRKLDKDQDGMLSPEEYRGKLNKKLSREEEKNIRNAKKKGTYKTPDQQFSDMDKDEKGYITLQEFIDFYTGMERANRGRGKYY